MCGKHNQFKPVRYFINAIFYRDAGHGDTLSELSLGVAYVRRGSPLDKHLM
jgi:hypothetical protein